MTIIIDRRKNPKQKSLGNRQRFLERFRGKIKDAAKKHINDRSISDGGSQEVNISDGGIDEPRFTHNTGNGDWEYVLPGNDEYLPGDHIPKPQGGAGGAGGRQGGKGGIGEDEFSFYLSYDEYLNLIFDDLELPDLIKASEKVILSHQMRRAGFTTAGVPSNLNIERTAIAGLSRRLALKSPKLKRIAELEEQLENETDSEKRLAIEEEISSLRIRANAINFLDKPDLRYNNFVPQPHPITQAVMFCIMDVSYSMGEKEKTISKKFFMLLHLFLRRRYKNIEVVFIRHHETAEECDEETFFTKKETGGTVVSTAYDLASKIIRERYNPKDWNIYIAQCSDGDNYMSDDNPLAQAIREIIDSVQFLAYLEIDNTPAEMIYGVNSNLWETIFKVKSEFPQVTMYKIADEDDILAIFRKFFKRKN